MTEHRLFDPADPPDFFTDSWYDTRDHAPHLEQPVHATRMKDVAGVVISQVNEHPILIESVVDLGAGDGGMLSLVSARVSVPCWGYDLQRTNVEYAGVRGQDVRLGNFMGGSVEWGDLAIITECLEHLPDPHRTVRRIAQHSKVIVASSPVYETQDSHDACHAWVWNMDGYEALIEQGGYQVVDHFISDPTGYGFQVICGRK